MKALIPCLLFALVAGCARSTNKGGDEDPRGEDVLAERTIAVSGTIETFPLAAAWMSSQGQTVPTLNGLTWQVEEPLKAALGDSLAVFGRGAVSATQTFSVADIPVALVHLGIAAAIRDDRETGNSTGSTASFVRASTMLYDVLLQEEKPQSDVVGAKAYALPTEFHNRLTTASLSEIQRLTDNQKSTLLGAGFILGQIVDAAGNGQSALTVAADAANQHLNDHFVYPTQNFEGLQTSTAAHGVFIFIHNGRAIEPFKLSVALRPEYKERNAGVMPDSAQVMVLAP